MLLAIGAAVTLAVGLFGPVLEAKLNLENTTQHAPIVPYGHIGSTWTPMLSTLTVSQFAEEGGMPPAMPPDEAERLLVEANKDGEPRTQGTEPWTPHKAIRQTTYFSSGWPFRCLTGSNLAGITDVALGAASQVSERSGLVAFNERPPRAAGGATGWFIITRPIWLGLAANTLFFAILAGMVYAGWLAAVARYRRSRNLCTACGHSRAGLGAGVRCPECGVG
ncbi:MAG: hypothetical protein QM783_15065 [Phycisphaerales bacterium]